MSNRTAYLHSVNSEQMLATHNSLPVEARHYSIETLNGIVAHLIDVALAAKHAHWNVRGPNFLSYHRLFDKVFDDLIEQIDAVGERATMLGGIARGTVQTVAATTQLPPYPVLSVSEKEHVTLLSSRLGQLGTDVRSAIVATGERGDIITADVLTETCAAIDSLLWHVESHSFGS